MKLRILTSLATAVTLVVLLFVAVGAQVKQPAEWITAKRLTVATQADIGTTLTAATVAATTLTADNAVFAAITAPTVTMTSATTWTVASLTATNLQAGAGTIDNLTITTDTTASGDVDIGGALDVTGASTLADATASGDVVIAGALTVTGTATLVGNVDTTGDLGVGDDLSVTGNVDATGNIEAVDHLLTQAELYLIPPATQTVIDGGTITGTGGIVEVTAASEVTATLVTAGDGQVLILVNVGSNAINIADAGTTKLAGALALGADDTVMLIGAGVTWYEVNRSAN